ncbi:MAG: nitrate reductase molybdenum cofactor assembly chaperone [Conexivisphaera sp.]|jgi:nitrate reductase delta subunit
MAGPGCGDLLRIIASLLRYPDDDFPAVARSSSGMDAGVDSFLEKVAGMDLIDLQRAYVESFDMSEETSPYVTYHVHGDDPSRGRALLAFADAYRRHGVGRDPRELPDHLPEVLLLLAAIDCAGEDYVLSTTLVAAERIERGLRDMGSLYADLLGALVRALRADGP